MPNLFMEERTIISSIENDIVIESYNQALLKSKFDFNDPANIDIKNKLVVGDKCIKKDWTSRIARFTHLGHGATYTLTPLKITLKEWPFELHGELTKKLTQELACARLKKRGYLTPTEEQLHQSILDTSSLIVNSQIDNHYILICELLTRIAGVALASDFDKEKVIETVHEDKYVLLLKNFIDELMSDTDKSSELFASQNIFAFIGASRVSSYAHFLKREMAESWAQSINSMIFNTLAYERPKHIFDTVSTCIKAIRTTKRGHLLVYLHELSKAILNRPLITKADQINAKVIDTTFESALSFLKSKLPRSTLNTLVVVNKESTNVSEWHEQGYKMVLEVFKAEVRERTNDEQLKYMPMIKELQIAFEIDMQLLLINDAVGQFTYLSELGGWIPIMLGLISPEKLAAAINQFINNVQATQFNPQKINPALELALLSLPNLEWTKFSVAVAAMKSLNNKHVIEGIRKRFHAHFDQLTTVQEKLVAHKLLEEDERLLSPIASPLLTAEYKITHAENSSSIFILTPTPPQRSLRSGDTPPSSGDDTNYNSPINRRQRERRNSLPSHRDAMHRDGASSSGTLVPRQSSLTPRNQASLNFFHQLEAKPAPTTKAPSSRSYAYSRNDD